MTQRPAGHEYWMPADSPLSIYALMLCCDRCGTTRRALTDDDRCGVCGPVVLCVECYAAHEPTDG